MVAEPFRSHPTNTDEEDAALAPLLSELNVVYGSDLIGKPVYVRIRPRAQMPRYRKRRPTDTKPEDGRAFGYWHRRPRVVDLALELIGKPAELRKVGAHESIHVRAEDFEAWHWDHLLPMLDPEPESRFDQTIGDDDLGYPATPEECIATFGSAAIFGFWPPAFESLYKRRFPRGLHASVRATILARAPMQESCAKQSARIAELEAQLREASERAMFAEGVAAGRAALLRQVRAGASRASNEAELIVSAIDAALPPE